MVEEKRYASPKGEIHIFKVTNAKGGYVELSTLGAGIISVVVPDKSGKPDNVALRYADPADYLYDGPCMGKIPGRYANRIAKGDLEVAGKKYPLNINNGPNALHGGPEGFQNQIWNYEVIENGVRFSYESKDGEENYPGNMRVEAEYRWSDENELILKISAVSDAETVVNLTNHAYWNLNGADSGSILNHEMKMKSSHYLPTDDSLIPTGELASVEQTPMDFRKTMRLGERINDDFPALKYGKGYDACWAIDEWKEGELTENVVELFSEKSGRRLRVSTDQPGVQIYTGNWLTGSPKNMNGTDYKDYEGVAIEAQGFPDAPHRKNFPNQFLKAGEKYERTIVFKFDTI